MQSPPTAHEGIVCVSKKCHRGQSAWSRSSALCRCCASNKTHRGQSMPPHRSENRQTLHLVRSQSADITRRAPGTVVSAPLPGGSARFQAASGRQHALNLDDEQRRRCTATHSRSHHARDITSNSVQRRHQLRYHSQVLCHHSGWPKK